MAYYQLKRENQNFKVATTLLGCAVAVMTGFAIFGIAQANNYAAKASEYAAKYRNELKNEVENDKELIACVRDAKDGEYCAVEYNNKGERVDTIRHAK